MTVPSAKIAAFIEAAKNSVVTPADAENYKRILKESEERLEVEMKASYAGQEFLNRVYSI